MMARPWEHAVAPTATYRTIQNYKDSERSLFSLLSHFIPLVLENMISVSNFGCVTSAEALDTTNLRETNSELILHG